MALNFFLKRSGTASKRPVAASMALGELDLNYDSATGGVFYKDSAGSVIKVGPAQVSSSAPNSSPAGSTGNSVGEFWYDTGASALKIWNGTVWQTTSGSGSGTVTSITAGTGLVGGTITGSGTIALDTTAVTPGAYTYASVTVDAYGRITLASSGAAPLPLSGGTMTGAITFIEAQVIPTSSIAGATTSVVGVVQLNNTTTSTSTTQALTANQGRNLQEQITALAVSTNIALGGTFNASTGLVDSVTAVGTTAGLVVGNALPTPGPTNNEVFVIVDVQGSTGPSGTPPYHVGDWFLSDGTTWNFLNVGFAPGQATTSSQGTVQLATNAEVQAGTDTNKAVVSSSLQSKLSNSTSTTSSTTIASSTAVKSAYDLADAAVPDASYTARGVILSGTGAGTYSALAVGTNGQVLTACSACASGLTWAAGGGGGALATPLTGGLVFGCSNGGNNVSLGGGAIRNLCGTSERNVAMGSNAMTCLTTNHCCNIAIGTSAMFGTLASTGFRCNVAIGDQSMSGVSGANVVNNVYVGAGTSGGGVVSNNAAVGFNSQGSNCGSGNTSVGSCSLMNNTGSSNVAVGHLAGWALSSTAACNIMIGAGAGGCPSLGALTGVCNIIIGNNLGLPVGAGNCQLVLGDWLTGCCDRAIRPAAGVMDCAGSKGTAGQVLMSNGSNAICWGTAGGGGGGSPATPTVGGIVLGCTNANSTALGCNALLAVTTGLANVGVGVNAGRSFTSGGGTFVGTRAGCAVTTGFGSTAIGADAGGVSATASTGCNTSVGYRTGCALTTGVSNTLMGYEAGWKITAGDFNTAVGHQALSCLTNFGSCSTALGHQASCSSTGVGVTSVGAFTGGSLGNSGSFNTLLGFISGSGVTSGCANVIIGSATNTGAASPVFAITDQSNRFVAGSTAVTNAYVQVAWTVVSDARDKIVQGGVPHGLDFVNQLEPKAFHFKEERDSDVPNGPLRYGFLAQDVLALEGGDGIIIDAEDPDKLRYNGEALVPVLVNAIKELSAKNDALEARLAAMENVR